MSPEEFIGPFRQQKVVRNRRDFLRLLPGALSFLQNMQRLYTIATLGVRQEAADGSTAVH